MDAQHGFYWSDHNDVITPQMRADTVIVIDQIIAETPQQPQRPTFQTGVDLFGRDHFGAYKTTFINACLSLIPSAKGRFSIATRCSAYMDYWDNFKLKDREAQWHFHEGAYFSGIFYLHIPDSMDMDICGTEFRDPDIYVPPRVGNWLIFPGRTLHRPGVSNTNDRRYVLAADFVINVTDR